MPNNDLRSPRDAAPADERQAELIGLVAEFAPTDGLHDTPVPKLQLIRASAPAQRLPSVYEPGLCVVVQGRKQATLAGEVFRYDALNYLVISVTLPVVGQILEATPEKPYLCVRLNVDPREVGAMMLDAGVGQFADHRRVLWPARLARIGPPVGCRAAASTTAAHARGRARARTACGARDLLPRVDGRPRTAHA